MNTQATIAGAVFITVFCLKFIIHPLAVYFKDPLDLRIFPAPGYGLAGITNFWNAYQVYLLRRFKVVHSAHMQLGPIIRVQPGHLSFNVPEAAAQIYGHGSKMHKADFYEIFRSADGEKNIVGARSKSEHSRKRKMVSPGFAMVNVLRMQPAINEVVNEFFSMLDQETMSSRDGRPLNLRIWINLLTFDIIEVAGYGESMGFVRQKSDWAPAQSRDGKKNYLTQVIEPFHEVSVLESILGLWPEYLPTSRKLLWWTAAQGHGTAFIDICIKKLRERVSRGPPFAYKDLFGHYLTDRHERNLNLPFEELVTEGNVSASLEEYTEAHWPDIAGDTQR
jgi:benzoate 4-monooxygenase